MSTDDEPRKRDCVTEVDTLIRSLVSARSRRKSGNLSTDEFCKETLRSVSIFCSGFDIQLIKRRRNCNDKNNEDEKRSRGVVRIPTKAVLARTEEGRPSVYIDPQVYKNLLEHQIDGIKFMWKQCFGLEDDQGQGSEGAILAHCMGSGKTLTTVAFVHAILTCPVANVKSVLILCACSTEEYWIKQFQSWLKGISRRISLHHLRSVDGLEGRICLMSKWRREGGVAIMSYESFRSTLAPKFLSEEARQDLLDPGPDVIVYDDAHRLGNENTILVSKLRSLKTRRRIALTSSAMTEVSERDHYSLLWGVILSYENPTLEDIHHRSGRYVHNFTYHQFASLKLLPEITECEVKVNLTALQKELYNRVTHQLKKRAHLKLKDLKNDFITISDICFHPAACLRNNAAQSAGSDLHEAEIQDAVKQELENLGLENLQGDEKLEAGAKCSVLFHFVEYCVSAGDKVLVFSHHKHYLDLIEEFLATKDRMTTNAETAGSRLRWRKDRDYYRLDADLKVEERQRNFDDFNDPKSDAKLFLISNRIATDGIHLVGANRVIICDSYLTESDYMHAIFRSYRLGQTKPCSVFHLIAGGTLEDRAHKVQKGEEIDEDIDFYAPVGPSSCQPDSYGNPKNSDQEPVLSELLSSHREYTQDVHITSGLKEHKGLDVSRLKATIKNYLKQQQSTVDSDVEGARKVFRATEDVVKAIRSYQTRPVIIYQRALSKLMSKEARDVENEDPRPVRIRAYVTMESKLHRKRTRSGESQTVHEEPKLVGIKADVTAEAKFNRKRSKSTESHTDNGKFFKRWKTESGALYKIPRRSSLENRRAESPPLFSMPRELGLPISDNVSEDSRFSEPVVVGDTQHDSTVEPPLRVFIDNQQHWDPVIVASPESQASNMPDVDVTSSYIVEERTGTVAATPTHEDAYSDATSDTSSDSDWDTSSDSYSDTYSDANADHESSPSALSAVSVVATVGNSDESRSVGTPDIESQQDEEEPPATENSACSHPPVLQAARAEHAEPTDVEEYDAFVKYLKDMVDGERPASRTQAIEYFLGLLYLTLGDVSREDSDNSTFDIRECETDARTIEVAMESLRLRETDNAYCSSVLVLGLTCEVLLFLRMISLKSKFTSLLAAYMRGELNEELAHPTVQPYIKHFNDVLRLENSCNLWEKGKRLIQSHSKMFSGKGNTPSPLCLLSPVSDLLDTLKEWLKLLGLWHRLIPECSPIDEAVRLVDEADRETQLFIAIQKRFLAAYFYTVHGYANKCQTSGWSKYTKDKAVELYQQIVKDSASIKDPDSRLLVMIGLSLSSAGLLEFTYSRSKNMKQIKESLEFLQQMLANNHPYHEACKAPVGTSCPSDDKCGLYVKSTKLNGWVRIREQSWKDLIYVCENIQRLVIAVEKWEEASRIATEFKIEELCTRLCYDFNRSLLDDLVCNVSSALEAPQSPVTL